MEKIEKQPSSEGFREVELMVIQPQMDKNFMIAFNTKNERLCRLYNSAISTILEKAGFRVFHQVGSDQSSGYQAWELWSEVAQDQLESLLQDIHREAERNFESDKEMYE